MTAFTPSPDAPDWNQIQATQIIAKPEKRTNHEGEFLVLPTNHGELYLSFYPGGVRLRSHVQRVPDYALLNLPEKSLDFDWHFDGDDSNHNDGQDLIVTSGEQRLEISQRPLAFSASNSVSRCRSATDGHFVRQHRLPPFAKTEEGWYLSIDLHSNERVYGLGEKWGRLDKRGQLLRSYNSDALGVNAEISYKNTPFCWSPDGWGIFLNTPAPVVHAVGFPAWSQRSYCALVEDDYLDCFVMLASSEKNIGKGAELIERYSQLTGFAPPPPLWSGGVILSKAYYRTADEIIDAAEQVRAHNMPCDVITFDGRAWQDTRTRFSFDWDESRYPDPKPVIDKLKGMGFKICVWEYPLISKENPWFAEFAAKGWLLKDQHTGEAYEFDWDQQAFGDVLTALPKSGLVDFTHPEAYAYWRDAHKPLFALGVDMIKADFGEQIEDGVIAYNGERGRGLHNIYATLYNRCVYEAAQADAPSGPFLFSRASWIGCQQYNSQWGGDPQADWEGMAGNLRGGLSWGLSGGPFYATDVGGFYKDTRDDLLYVRWAQAAVFSAHYRLHGIGAREPWSYSPEASEAVLQALNLRYRLQHYLQQTMVQASQTGMPVQRPMVLAFPNEPASWAFENQFMFGDQVLVAPCLSPDHVVDFYLPEGDWVQFDLKPRPAVRLEGAKCHQMTLALDEMAVFVRADARVPLNKLVQQTDHLDLDEAGHIQIEEFWAASL